MSMKVGKSCEGCDYCEYEILNDYGMYEPGYYCYADHCIEEDSFNEWAGKIMQANQILQGWE